jgi:putative transcriptional regulator
MPIICNLSTLMGKNKMNIQDVCDKTGLARNTVAFLYHDKVKRADYATLDVLCQLFNCSVGDMLEYVPEGKKNPTE